MASAELSDLIRDEDETQTGNKNDVTDKCQQTQKEVKQVQETPNEEKQNGEHEIQADKKRGKTMRRTYNRLFSVGDHMTGGGSEQNMK